MTDNDDCPYLSVVPPAKKVSEALSTTRDNKMTPLRPTTAKERHIVLDALRGLALLGIALANFPEFALWTFLSADEQSAMPTAGVDRIVRFLQYMLVDG